jgi:hypothetical protein
MGKPEIERVFVPGGDFTRVEDRVPPDNARETGELPPWRPVPEGYRDLRLGNDPWAMGKRVVRYVKRKISPETAEFLRRAPREANEDVGDVW